MSSSSAPRRSPSTATPTTTTSNTQAMSQSHTQSSSTSDVPYIHPTFPSPPQHISQARAAVVASLSNMVDTSLTPRATLLHANAEGLSKQERDVERATAALRKEREALGKEADRAARRLKEVGNVQNWAEVLERQFVVLEETKRLVEEGSESQCSCSDCGRYDDSFTDEERDQKDGEPKGKEREDMAMADADDAKVAWSDASRSLNDRESSAGTGRPRGSETASTGTSP
ncbi:uncharacterized protein J7T54_004980 [Emericellopsis cladophorae]|uniref:Biogenesis of lysosome-related organelles complex 1 subunit 1 n=1 Tax=Emericellopsis cladophorae TaxID=2686198 RepID=A0A9P9Y2M2_9HYPO|nr:uncharacterized protein J7T54_004980 [Emericellopsis cladophorae]KAI6781814.1 hypothetical protein J7T54_004980 [Emericellopsis cladophorae]